MALSRDLRKSSYLRLRRVFLYKSEQKMDEAAHFRKHGRPKMNTTPSPRNINWFLSSILPSTYQYLSNDNIIHSRGRGRGGGYRSSISSKTMVHVLFETPFLEECRMYPFLTESREEPTCSCARIHRDCIINLPPSLAALRRRPSQNSSRSYLAENITVLTRLAPRTLSIQLVFLSEEAKG